MGKNGGGRGKGWGRDVAGRLQGRQGRVDAPRPSAVPRPVALRILPGAQLSGPTVCVQPARVRESTLGWRTRGASWRKGILCPGTCPEPFCLQGCPGQPRLVRPDAALPLPAWAASSHLLAVTCPRAAPA